MADTSLDITLGSIKIFKHNPTKHHGIQFSDNWQFGPNFGSGVFRREVFEKVGLLDEKLTFNEDHDWFLRAREENTSIVKVDCVDLFYRKHEKSMTFKHYDPAFGLTKILKQSLDRRRNAEKKKDLPLVLFDDLKMLKPKNKS